MAFENFPTVLQNIFQSNMLERKFWDQLESKKSYRGAAFRYPVEKRNGETMIYSRAGRITPVTGSLAPSINTGLDNGLTGIGGVGAANPTYPFEQWSVNIAQFAYSMDLNLVQAEEVIADIFKQNVVNLAENCTMSLDLIAAQALFRAYESGSSVITTAASSTTQHVDNVIGLDKAFATASITNPTGGTATFPYGSPQTVSPSNPLNVNIYPAAGGAPVPNTIIGVAVDGSNTSHMVCGQLVIGTSGTVTLGTTYAAAKGDVIVAADAPAYIRPNGKLSRESLGLSDANGIQLIINAVAQLRKNNIATCADGTYVCFIDPTMEAQVYTDPQFQIMTQGEEQSPTFKNGRIARNFGVTFVPVTNAPVYTFTNYAGTPVQISTHRALVMGERALMDCPFAGTFDALRNVRDGYADVRVVNDIVMVNRSPLDRFQQIMAMSWYWIGNFAVPTDATITADVMPQATPARYKRAICIEVAAAS
jgi:hypothetical protein